MCFTLLINIDILKNLAFKIVNRLGILINYFRIILSQNQLRYNANQKYFYIDLVDRGIDVYYSTLLYYLHEAGYVLVFNTQNMLFIGNIGGYFKYVHKLQKVIYCNFNEMLNLGTNFHYLYDHEHPKSHTSISKSLKLNFDYFNYKNDILKNKIVAPYPLHPSNYFITKTVDKLNTYRKQERKYRIFFSGNTHKSSYDNLQLKQEFDIHSRYEIIEFIKLNLNNTQLSIIKDNHSWNLVQKNGFKGLVLIDWYWNPKEKNVMGVKIDASKWLETLAYASFFLACPGVVMPHSHNLFESMAVGTIPIIQFGHIFYPPLEDGVNAIFYKDLEDLKIKIDYVINLNVKEIDQLSKNVVEYYEKHVSPQSFGHEIEKTEDGVYDMYLNVEYWSVQKMLKC